MTILYLHIGTEKTGTSSIQRFMDVNRELLRENGILYPVTPGRRNQVRLAMAAQNDRKRGDKRIRRMLEEQADGDAAVLRQRVRAGLAEELGGGDYRTAIMSSEHCSSRLHRPAEVARLKDMLSPLFQEIRIVVYLRRQDEFLLSTYSTSIKSGSTEPLRIPGPRRSDARYDHWALISRWAEVFGRDRIVCRRFDKSEMKSGDVIEDFLAAVGVDSQLPFRRPASVNESLDATSLEFLRLFNKFVPSSAGGGRDNLLRVLGARPSDGTFVTLDPEDLAGFMMRFRDSNRQVADAYFGGERHDSDDPLFNRRSDRRARAQPTPLTAEAAVEIAAWLWRRKSPEPRNGAAETDTPVRRSKRRQRTETASPAEP